MYYGTPLRKMGANAFRNIASGSVSRNITCEWQALREQLLQQWQKLSYSELEDTFHNRHLIAELIHHKYGISTEMAENYLYNFERTLPT